MISSAAKPLCRARGWWLEEGQGPQRSGHTFSSDREFWTSWSAHTATAIMLADCLICSTTGPDRSGKCGCPVVGTMSKLTLMKDPKGFVKRLLRELDEDDRANKPDPVVSSPFDRFGGADDQTAAETFRTDEDLSIRRDGDDEAPFREEEDRYGAEIDLGATEPIDEPTWFDELRKAVNLPGDEVASRAFESARSSIKYRERKLRLSAGAATGWSA